jgi:hypothetical protein
MTEFGPHFGALLDELERARSRRRAEEADRGWRAMMLAPTLEICRALLRGECVPVSRLDALWVRRFGLRRPT